MKFSVFAVLVVTWLVCATSCRRTHPIVFGRDTIECPRPGLTDTVRVTSNTEWRVTYAPLWIKTTAVGDTLLGVDISENRLSRTRTDSIVIEAGATRRALTVVQEGVATFLTVSERVLTFRSDGEERVLRVHTDGCFMHVTAPAWVRYFRLGDELHLVARANRTGDREGEILVTVDTLKRSIHYRQEIMAHLRKERELSSPSATQPSTRTSCPPPPVKKGNCRTCGGTGFVSDDYGEGEVFCPMCNGRGSY